MAYKLKIEEKRPTLPGNNTSLSAVAVDGGGRWSNMDLLVLVYVKEART